MRNYLTEVVSAKQAETESVYSERNAQRQVVAADRTSQWWIVQAAIRIANVVWNEPGITWSKVRRKLSKQQQGWAALALEHAIGEQWVTETSEEGQRGGEKRVLQPGTKRPPK